MTRLQKTLKELASKGYKITHHKQICGGINSAVYKIKEGKEVNFALKLYPQPTNNDKRDRCLTEVDFVKYIQTCQVCNTPKLEDSNVEESWALFSWVEGVKPTKLKETDLQEITQFIYAINAESTQFHRAQLKPASEACQSLSGMITCISERFKRVQSTTTTTKVGQEAKRWITTRLKPYFELISQKHLDNYARSTHWKDSEIQKIASPSDVGIHNTLLTSHGLYFLDFEYAGLDDLSKLAADWILQPNLCFSKEQEETFCELLLIKMKNHSGISWRARLEDIKPFIHVKWCLIMLSQLQTGKLDEQQLQKVLLYFEKQRLFFCKGQN